MSTLTIVYLVLSSLTIGILLFQAKNRRNHIARKQKRRGELFEKLNDSEGRACEEHATHRPE